MADTEANSENSRVPYIYNRERLENLDDLPYHVQNLIVTLLSVEFSPLKSLKQDFQEFEPKYTCKQACQVQPCKEYHGLVKLPGDNSDWDPLFSKKGLSKDERFRLQELHEPVIATQEDAFKLQGASEADWDSFYHDKFFKKLHKSTNSDTIDSYYHGRFKIQRNSLWTIFRRDDRWKDKQPKPDISLHIELHRENEGMISSSQHEVNPVIARNFSRNTHRHLANVAGLEPSPYNLFKEVRTSISEERPEDVCGYPWFIGEYKRKQSDKFSKAAQQAGRAAHFALLMYANLFTGTSIMRESDKCADPAETPPIVTMTTVGSQVYVWVAWRCIADPTNAEEDQSLMQCIWEGDMLLAQDIIMLHVILENTYTWVKNTLRPQISFFIDKWLRWYKLEPNPGTKPSTHRTRSDPTPLPRTPRASKKSTENLGHRVMQSYPGTGKKIGRATATSRRDLFPTASTSRINTRMRNFDDSPSARLRVKSTSSSACRSSEPVPHTACQQASCQCNQSPLVVKLPGSYPITDSEHEEADNEDEEEDTLSEDLDHDEADSNEYEEEGVASEYSYESELESLSDAASFDGFETPDQTGISFESLSPPTPCVQKQRRTSPRSSIRSQFHGRDS